MKKILPLLVGSLLFGYSSVLPNSFNSCSSVGFFDIKNPPIALKNSYLLVKKYQCENRIIYIGIKKQITGFLKVNLDKNSKNFLIKHFNLNHFHAVVYIDKNLKKGVIDIQLNENYTLEVLFYGKEYKSIIKLLENLDLNRIKEGLS